MAPWKRRFLLDTIIFWFHVKLGEGICCFVFLGVCEFSEKCTKELLVQKFVDGVSHFF